MSSRGQRHPVRLVRRSSLPARCSSGYSQHIPAVRGLPLDVAEVLPVYKTIPLAALLILGLAPALAPAAAPPSPASWRPTVERLIAQLGDRDYRAREEAERQLFAMGPGTLPLLRQALGSRVPDVRRRAFHL